jgi:2,4-diaminopentanoate dehydrogenase
LAIPVVLMGLGAIGRGIARAALQKPELEIVAAVDLHPTRTGKKLAEVLACPAPELEISGDAAAALKKAQGGVLLHATSSRLAQVEGELAQACSAGLSVASTCEELAYPWLANPEIADRLDRIAQKRKVALLGTGVNPGFVFDRLVATLSHAVGPIDRIKCLRVVDSKTRRVQLQRKSGAGLSEEEFASGDEDGTIGHVGLKESAALAALGAGLEIDHVDEEIDPVETDDDQNGAEGLYVPKGGIVGLRQVAKAIHEEKVVVELELIIALGAPDPRDEIELVGGPGVPGLKVVIPGGVQGDHATSWTIVHSATLLPGAEPGLITVLDLPAGR